MASPLFGESLRDNLGLELFLDIHLAQSQVLLLQLLHACHERCIHAAELGPPLVKSRRADSQFATQLGDGQPGLCPLEYVDDLAIGETRFLDGRDSPVRLSTSQRSGFAGGLPPHAFQCYGTEAYLHQGPHVTHRRWRI